MSRSSTNHAVESRVSQAPPLEGMGMDQLQDLMLSFNETAERLHETHEALHQQVRTLESELAEANEQLRRSQQLAALGEMAAGIAHEIRNPLGSIQLYAQVLVEDLDDRPDSMDLCRKIGTAVRGMESIVRDVLQFARDTSLQQEHVTMGEIIDRVLFDSEGLMATESTTIRRDSKADLMGVHADLTLMTQAIGNILRNAVESMTDSPSEDRVVTIDTRILRRLRPDGERHEIVAVSIADRGCGVPEELIHRLFNPFFTTRPTGTGLGLAIAHRVVDAHGGDIVVNARAGGGTVFEVHVPVKVPNRDALENQEAEAR
ncbi:MAG: ATP-binding protein [Phycisphaerales bacterium]|nr:ATP-binding protein [Phycisphaerales bacterium]